MRDSPATDIPPIGFGRGEPGLVSVVIPTYNRGYLIGEAIESALRRDHGRVGILVAMTIPPMTPAGSSKGMTTGKSDTHRSRQEDDSRLGTLETMLLTRLALV